jgi:predicted ATP-dependent protease
MNQHGEVQPVGGVTEKVEGFHRACKLHGMTGSQGVVIPKSNLKNLVLNDGVLSDIKQGRFHIWTVEHVDDAIELLTGKKAGKLTKTGGYERGSVNYLVIKALQKAREISENRVKTLKRRKTRKSK